MLPQFINKDLTEKLVIVKRSRRNKLRKTYITIFHGTYGTLARSNGNI